MTTEEAPSVAQLTEFTESTTIHGVKYLSAKQRPRAEKIFWVVIFGLSFIFLAFFVQDLIKKFNLKSAILVEDEQPTRVHSIPFPAVTICPAIKIKNEFLSFEETRNWFAGASIDNMVFDLVSLVCHQQLIRMVQKRNNDNPIRFLNKSHIDLLMKISPSYDEIFQDLKFPSIKKYNIGRLFSFILTNEGVCFTFNVPADIIRDEKSLQTEYKYYNMKNKSNLWDSDSGYYKYSNFLKFPISVWGSGPERGLQLILGGNSTDLNTACQPSQLGYKILLHSPDEYPTTNEKFISIPHNTMAQIRITPRITKTSYNLWHLTPQMRQCFFNHERKLKYFTFYNRINCKLECAANYSQQQYGCVHFSLPRNTSQPICGPGVKINQLYDTEEIMDSYFDYKALIPDQYEANLEIDDELLDKEKNSNFHCNCLPACNSVEYQYSVEMESIEIEKILKKYYPEDRGNASIAPAVIDIFFGTTKVTGRTRKQFYTFTDLLSNIGGLLGLFMGASIISIFEIIYFLLIR